jgi:hypothetical protein
MPISIQVIPIKSVGPEMEINNPWKIRKRFIEASSNFNCFSTSQVE